MGISEVLGAPLKIAAIYDRDYFCEEQLENVVASLSAALVFAHVHSRKEIENYLLVPPALQRAIDRSIEIKHTLSGRRLPKIDVNDLLSDITDPMEDDVQGQIQAKRGEYLRSSGRDLAIVNAETIKGFKLRWKNLASRLDLVPGKEVIAKLRAALQEKTGASLTDTVIINSFRREDFPEDLINLLRKLNEYRQQ